MQTDSSFDTDTTAYKLIGKLSELRQQNDAIAYGTTTIRYSNDDVLIYERKFYDDVILVAINRQPDKAYTIDNVETLLPEGEYVDFLGGMLNGENISVYASTGINTTASITLDGGEVGVWQYDALASCRLDSAPAVHIVRYKGRVIAANRRRSIEKGSFHVLLDVADFGGVFLHTVQYKADMFAVQFHKFCFYKLCRVVVPGDTDCSSFGADGFKNKGKDFLYPVPVKVSVLYQIVVLDIVLDDFLIHAVCVCRFLSLPFRQLCRVL